MDGIVIENKENGDQKVFEYTKYRRNIVYAIREKVTHRGSCTLCIGKLNLRGNILHLY